MLKSNEKVDLFTWLYKQGNWINRGIGRRYKACGETI